MANEEDQPDQDQQQQQQRRRESLLGAESLTDLQQGVVLDLTLTDKDLREWISNYQTLGYLDVDDALILFHKLDDGESQEVNTKLSILRSQINLQGGLSAKPEKFRSYAKSLLDGSTIVNPKRMLDKISDPLNWTVKYVTAPEVITSKSVQVATEEEKNTPTDELIGRLREFIEESRQEDEKATEARELALDSRFSYLEGIIYRLTEKEASKLEMVYTETVVPRIEQLHDSLQDLCKERAQENQELETKIDTLVADMTDQKNETTPVVARKFPWAQVVGTIASGAAIIGGMFYFLEKQLDLRLQESRLANERVLTEHREFLKASLEKQDEGLKELQRSITEGLEYQQKVTNDQILTLRQIRGELDITNKEIDFLEKKIEHSTSDP